MYTYKTLEDIDLSIIHKAFMDAFSNYFLKMTFSIEDFEKMLLARSYNPKLSIGIFHDNKLIGFLLNAHREIGGKHILYDVSTGIIPAYKNKKLSKTLFPTLAEKVDLSHIDEYKLEVIVENKPAIRLYEGSGFKVTRKLDCYSIDKSIFSNASLKHKYLTQDFLDLSNISLGETKPSWQNSTYSLDNERGRFSYASFEIGNDVIAYGVVNTKTGNIPQLAVHKDFRRRGIGKEILSILANNTTSTSLSINNLDASDTDFKNFLNVLNFKYNISQYEMTTSNLNF